MAFLPFAYASSTFNMIATSKEMSQISSCYVSPLLICCSNNTM